MLALILLVSTHFAREYRNAPLLLCVLIKAYLSETVNYAAVQARPGSFVDLNAAKSACEEMEGACSGITDDPATGVARANRDLLCPPVYQTPSSLRCGILVSLMNRNVCKPA